MLRELARLRRAAGASTTSSQAGRARREAIKVGDPLNRDVYLGPVINEAAVDTYEQAVEEARKDGTVVTGGERLTDGDIGAGQLRGAHRRRGAEGSPRLQGRAVRAAGGGRAGRLAGRGHPALANDTEYGLTAGLYSEDDGEIQEWLDRIQAGVVYVNRRAGATTGAWPGVQPFGGWKGSGTTGKAGGGPYYVTQYMREQSRTVIEE